MTAIQRFVEWLRKEGFSVRLDDGVYCAYDESDGVERYLEFRDTEEEQPEALVWILKELERTGEDWALTREVDGSYLLQVRLFDQCAKSGTGPAMTLAAMRALTGEE